MTIDRRPIFTVGMVWTDLVKRLPRTAPRYRDARELPGLSGMLSGLQQAQASQKELATLYSQHLQHQPYFGLNPFPWTWR